MYLSLVRFTIRRKNAPQIRSANVIHGRVLNFFFFYDEFRKVCIAEYY